jgi:outer membrane protein TolC
MVRKFVSLLLLGFLHSLTSLAGPPEAGQTPILQLQEAIEIALESNHHLKISTAGVQLTEAATREAHAPLLPKLEFTELMSRSSNPALVFSQLLNQEAFKQEYFDVDFLNRPDPINNFTSRLSVYQPLWAGGRLRGGEEAAGDRHEAAVSWRERTRQQVIHEIVKAYSGAIQARAQLAVALESRETARAHVKLAADLRDAGLVVESDLLSARVRESELEELVIAARGALEVADASLNLVMGRPQNVPVSLPTEIDTDSGPLADLDDTESLIARALLERPDLAAADHQLDATEWSVRRASSGYKGDLGVLGAFEANDENFIGASGTNWTVMATFRISIYDGGDTRARVAQAKEGHRQLELTRELLEEEIALEVRRASTGYSTAQQRLVETRKAVQLARESLRMIEDRYQEGLTPLVELLEAENALTRARTREVAARRDLFVARSGLDLAVGRL